MKNTELKKYFDEVLYDPGLYDPDKEENLLEENLQDVKAYNSLYPEGVNLDDRQRFRRDTILHLYLWDKYYHIASPNDSDFLHVHYRWWNEKKKSHIMLCLEEGDKNLSDLIYDIISHWDFLKRDIFGDVQEDLDDCKSIEDYQSFIEKYPNTYPEYLLKAEYIIAKETHTPFKNLQRAKKEYGDCEWVKRIKCGQTNSGITYMITEDVNDCDKQLLISFLESFSRIHIDNNEGITKRNDILVSNYVVTEKIWNIVMRHSSLFPVNEERPKLIKYDEANSFINQLQKMLCVIFRMPTINERAKIGLKGRTENEIPPHVWEWCQPIVKNTAKVPVVCVMANQNIDDSCLLDYHVPKSCYAACRLVIDV